MQTYYNLSMTDLSSIEVSHVLREYKQLVLSIANSAYFSSSSIDRNDLIQIGNLAVIRAVASYDPSNGKSIKNYVGALVRQDVYREAGKFLGVFTVDPRTTSLAARVHEMHKNDLSDKEIAVIVDKSTDEVKNLRLSYVCRITERYPDNIPQDEDHEEVSLQDILDSVTCGNVEKVIFQDRLIGDSSAQDVATKLHMSRKDMYVIERSLRERVLVAIQEIQ